MASRFWVGGTGTWDASDTTHWAATSNGAGGQSVPGAADTVTFDGLSGGGTVTPNTTVNIQSLTTGAFTGTLDFSANNNNVTLSSSTGFAGSGAGTRTVNLGNGTWTLSGGAATFDIGTATGLTFNANSSVINFSSTTPTGTRILATGGKTFATVTVPANTTGFLFQITGTLATIATLTINGTNNLTAPNGTTTTITNLNLNGSVSAPIGFSSQSASAIATVAVTSATIAGTALKLLTFTGSPTATNSLDQGGNTGITITPPSGGGGGGRNFVSA